MQRSGNPTGLNGHKVSTHAVDDRLKNSYPRKLNNCKMQDEPTKTDKE
jgi:hypothetical protein